MIEISDRFPLLSWYNNIRPRVYIGECVCVCVCVGGWVIICLGVCDVDELTKESSSLV